MRTTLTTVALALALTGCFASGRTTWVHPQLDNQTAQTRFVIDRGECAAMANQAAPTPVAPQSNYNFAPQTTRSDFTMYSSSGNRYSGEITTRPGPVNPMAGFNAGYQHQAAQQQYQQAQQLQTDYYNSCMYRRGWTLQRVR